MTDVFNNFHWTQTAKQHLRHHFSKILMILRVNVNDGSFKR